MALAAALLLKGLVAGECDRKGDAVGVAKVLPGAVRVVHGAEGLVLAAAQGRQNRSGFRGPLGNKPLVEVRLALLLLLLRLLGLRARRRGGGLDLDRGHGRGGCGFGRLLLALLLHGLLSPAIRLTGPEVPSG